MKGYFNKSVQIFLNFSLLLIILMGLMLFTIDDMPRLLGLFFYGVALCTTSIGIWRGAVASLAFSLLVIFITGSYWFWKLWFDESALVPDLSNVFIWMVATIIIAILSGTIHQVIHAILAESQKLKSDYDQLVSIDPVTGFYNRKRFFFELEQEYKRAERYGSHLSLLCIRIAYLDQFSSIYGQNEVDYLFNQTSDQIRSSVRLSDRLFKVDEDLIAIVLTETPEQNVRFVIDKLEKELKNHTLSDLKRQVTLNLAFGYSSYNQLMADYMEMFHDAEEGTKNFTV